MKKHLAETPPRSCIGISRANAESVTEVRLDLLIPTGKLKGRTPGPASIYRMLAGHKNRQAVEG